MVGLARLRRSCHSRIEGARQPGPGSSCEIAASTGLGHSPRSRNALSCLVAAPRCCNFGLKERSLNGGRRDGVGASLKATFLSQAHYFYLVVGWFGEAWSGG